MKALWSALLACVFTVASAWITPTTDERAMYGMEGPVEQNLQPRVVAGWPAPFLADDPGSSVIHQIGAEDTFRPGPFVATLAFWYVIASALWSAGRLLLRYGRRRR